MILPTSKYKRASKPTNNHLFTMNTYDICDYAIAELIKDHILENIFSYLSLRDLKNCALVCKTWFRILSDENNDVWRLNCVKKLAEEVMKSDLLSNLPTYKTKLRAFYHAWSPYDCSRNIYIKPNGFTLHRNPVAQSTDACRAKIGFYRGRHAWEVIWEGPLGTVAVVGISTKEAPLQCQGYVGLLGSDEQSWGWNLVDNHLLSCPALKIQLCWTCLVVYRGHVWPVWDVRWSPYGHYFASAGHDRTARLWATDHHQPLRIFAGHHSDVDCIQFHPNSNYIATGSSDRTVRLWDCLTGTQVRLMTGHKSTPFTLAFSVCGRWIASGGGNGEIVVWDISSGLPTAAPLPRHAAPVHALAFSRDGTILSSGSLDSTIKLWDFAMITDETTSDENGTNNTVQKEEKFLLRSFATKNSPIKNLHFTRRNLLLAVGSYEGSS